MTEFVWEPWRAVEVRHRREGGVWWWRVRLTWGGFNTGWLGGHESLAHSVGDAFRKAAAVALSHGATRRWFREDGSYWYGRRMKDPYKRRRGRHYQ